MSAAISTRWLVSAWWAAMHPYGEGSGQADDRPVVRRIQPYQATKTYRCPGCDQEISPGVGHVAVWREGELDERRHWHTACWHARETRRPRVQRSRDAPRH
ncbi:MAG TPA: hypothetical protein VEZ46_06600 [Mycobacteriales bacterium]|jgi:hypothetical protein|nr:hypothetical protein [Mycobacteriales bacterium]